MQTSNRKMKMNSNDNDDSGGDRDHNKPIANRAAVAAAPTINRRRNKPEDQTQTIRGCTAEIHSVFATLRWQTNRTFFNGKIFGHSLPWATLCLYLSLAVFTVFFSIFGASLFRTALRNFLFSSSRFFAHTHTRIGHRPIIYHLVSACTHSIYIHEHNASISSCFVSKNVIHLTRRTLFRS